MATFKWWQSPARKPGHLGRSSRRPQKRRFTESCYFTFLVSSSLASLCKFPLHRQPTRITYSCLLLNSPYDDPSLSISTGTAQQSPFVIAFQRSGVKVVPSIINAIVCTSAISSGSACIFIASRTLYGLSCDGHAPRIFQRCNRFGTPHYAIGLTCVLLPLVYLNVANNTSVVFGWFVNITTVSGLIGWVVIEATYLRFYAGLKKQGYSRDGKIYL